LEHADLDAAIAATQATLERTKAELVEHEIQIQQYERQFQRAEKLLGTRGISESAHDEAKYLYEISVARRDTLAAAVDLAQARAREAEQMKENMFVRAPFDATVISKDAEVGESIMPGGMGEASGRGSVVTIADLDHLEVDTDVKEDYISRAQIGQPAEVTVDAVPGKRYQGRVRKIIPMGDRARATIKVKVEILDPDPRLFPEMSSTVYFLPEARDDETSVSELAQRKLFCPAAAVQAEGEQRFVWVVDDQDQAHRTSVSVGAPRVQQIEIATGLSGGERVIVNPPDDLQDGQPVKIAE
jgi:RND family efflux transporter MFP subunit